MAKIKTPEPPNCKKRKREKTFKDRLQLIGRRSFEFCAYFSGALLVHVFWFSGHVPLQPYVQVAFWIYCVSSMTMVFIYYYALRRCASLFHLTIASFLLASLPIMLSHDKSIYGESKDMASDILRRFGLVIVVLVTFRLMTYMKSLCLNKGFLGFFFVKEDTEFLFE